MNIALQKTITLLLLIGLGLLLRSKIKNKTEMNGLKELILSVALPTTVFVALMKIKVEFSLIIYPLLTLAFNFFIYFVCPYIFTLFRIPKQSPTARTLQLLLPSLAPGLSCFPFVLEYLGDQPLALAAMADVGNKFFALNFLYFIAMAMYLKNNNIAKDNSSKNTWQSLLLSLVKEPINIVLLMALALLTFHVTIEQLPVFFTDMVDKLAVLMTPLILIFIGMAVQFKDGKIKLISSVLLIRAGLTFLFTYLVIQVFGLNTPTQILLALVIPLSSCSFWPFAHMNVFHLKEEEAGVKKEVQTFDINLALLVLAFSLPFSTIMIIVILSSGTMFAQPTLICIIGLSMLLLGFSIFHFKKMARQLKSFLKPNGRALRWSKDIFNF